ncbi:MAG TPA: hypothetical protein VF487_20250 [Chitinophagaceae bacterium]
MKKYLVLFAIITTTNCAAQSSILQSKSDTLCFQKDVIQKMLIAAQQKRLLQEEVNILEQRTLQKQAIINTYEGKDSINAAIIATYQAEIKVMKNQRGVYDAELKSINRTLKRQKRKTFFTAMAGVATTTAAIFLFK